MDATAELKALMAKMDADGVKIVYKQTSWFWRVLAKLVYVVTLGRNNTFLDGYVTTLNKTIAVPASWATRDDLGKLETLTHELTHVAQYQRYTPVVMALLYLFVFLPIGLAYFRWRFEREAYCNGYNKLLQYRPDLRAALVDRGVSQMTSGQYAWTWPFQKTVRAYFEAHVNQVSK
jgi:hypothetical protein